MNLLTALSVTLLCCATVHPEQGDQHRSFSVDIPSSAGSGSAILLLRDVALPANRGSLLRAYLASGDANESYLGSAGIPGVSLESPGTRRVGDVRIAVSSALQRWRQSNASSTRVTIRLRAFAEGGDTLATSAWSVRAVSLEASR